MTDGTGTPVSVSRQIQAPAEKLFEVLAGPASHPGIDGSGMLRHAIGAQVMTGAGDAFKMSMHNDEMGDYEMTNCVVEYQPNRRIGWEPVLTAASREEDQADLNDRAGHEWIFELARSARTPRW